MATNDFIPTREGEDSTVVILAWPEKDRGPTGPYCTPWQQHVRPGCLTVCLKLGMEISRGAATQACATCCFGPVPLILQMCMVDGHHNQSCQSTPVPSPATVATERLPSLVESEESASFVSASESAVIPSPLQESLEEIESALELEESVASASSKESRKESEFRDSAWPLYSIFSNIAEGEINRMVERCQRDTDGTLIFVSSHLSPQVTPRINWNVERFILCHRRCIAFGLNPRPQAKFARYLRILPKEHISPFWQHKHF